MARRIPQNKIDEIYALTDIVDVVSDFVQLKKRGSNFFGLSPWSSEKTPSFTVAPAKGIFKDFSSGKGGNAVTFLMDLEGMTYVEALEWLAKKYGIDLEIEETQVDRSAEDKKDSLYILNDFALKWFREQLKSTDEGKRTGLGYFRERGLLESTMETFHLGYSPESWDAFAKAAAEQQFKEEFLLESGLCFRSDSDGRVLDRYRGRIIFPIHNHMGKVVGFAGRIIGKKEGVAKYVNSPETPVYHKSKVLYGLFQNKQHIRDLDQALMVEGYMDLISLHQNGVRNAVASSGTALTVDQIRLLKRFTHNVLLVYDADPAGIRAALRGVDLLLENELKVKVLVLPEGHDPDSFVMEKGQAGFEQFAKENAKDFIDFKIGILSQEKNLNDPSERAAIVHETADTLVKIPDPVLLGVYVNFTAEKLGVPVHLVESAVRRATTDKLKQNQRDERLENRKREKEAEKSGSTPIPAASIPTQEKELIRILVNYPDASVKPYEDESEVKLSDYIFMEMGELDFDEPALETIRMKIEQNQKQYGIIKVDRLFDICEEGERMLLSDLLAVPEAVSKNWETYDIKAPVLDENPLRSADSALSHFQLKKLKMLLRKNMQDLKSEKDPEQIDNLLHTQVHLMDLKNKLSAKLGIVIND